MWSYPVPLLYHISPTYSVVVFTTYWSHFTVILRISRTTPGVLYPPLAVASIVGVRGLLVGTLYTFIHTILDVTSVELSLAYSVGWSFVDVEGNHSFCSFNLHHRDRPRDVSAASFGSTMTNPIALDRTNFLTFNNFL